MVVVLVLWVPRIVQPEVGSLATQVFGFTMLLMESLLRPPLLPMTVVAPQHWQYGPHLAPKMCARFAQEQTLCAHDHSHHMVGRVKRPPPPKDGGYLSNGDSTME